MPQPLKPDCLPLLIGSLPLDDHLAASRLIMDYTPAIPLWIQLPVFPEEGMVPQFLPGMPGVVSQGGKTFIDTAADSFDDDLLLFFEDYMATNEDPDRLPTSRFALTETTGKGVAALLETLGRMEMPPVAVKGQVTGPVTFCTGVKDQDGRAIFYNETLREAAVISRSGAASPRAASRFAPRSIAARSASAASSALAARSASASAASTSAQAASALLRQLPSCR